MIKKIKQNIFIYIFIIVIINITLVGCLEEEKDNTNLNKYLKLGIDVINYQYHIGEHFEINLIIRNIGNQDMYIGEINIPETLQFYITTPMNSTLFCTNYSMQKIIDYGIVSTGKTIEIIYDLSNMTFVNDTTIFNFSTEGEYLIKAVFKDYLESNVEKFNIHNLKTVNMTVQQFINDVEINFTNKKLVIDYESLAEGDTINLYDDIDEIIYLRNEDITQINFTVESFKLLNSTTTNVTFDFRGDITNEYKKGDKVVITFHIKSMEWVELAGDEIIIEFAIEIAQESAIETVEQEEQYERLLTLEGISNNFPPEILPPSSISHR
jgi:hypothetical protein